jgi:two-component system response regulator DevR
VTQAPVRALNRVVVIDDHPVVRSGIKSALIIDGFDVVAEASTLSEAYAQIAHKNPDAIVVDINLPDGSGLEIVQWARGQSPTVAIVVLTLNESEEFLLASAKSGASAYILKSAPLTDLVIALNRAIAAPLHFAAQAIVAAMEQRADKFHLTSRELQVLAILDSDEGNAALSAGLFITEATFKTHLASIYRKLDVKNRVGALKRAKSAGLL